ncbi:hypothetical protein M0802_016020, partial [Mischocyttarus mexicanus]
VKCGYATISHEATRVLAGVIPIDLYIKEKAKIWRDVKEGKNKEESQTERRRETMEEWQKRWEETEKGRETFQYFPNVEERINLNLKMNYYVTQFISGHGKFNSKLKMFNLAEEMICDTCREEETA